MLLTSESAEFLVDLGERYAKNNEFVQLKLTTAMDNTIRVDEDDIYLSVKTQMGMLKNHYEERHLSSEVHIFRQEGPYIITVTGQLAHDLLELDDITVYQTMGDGIGRVARLAGGVD